MPNSAKKSILIIDDETDFCLLLKNFLMKKNFDVAVSHTLREGLNKLDELKPDILFLDNNLPDGLGWEHTQRILETYPSTKIHLISAYQYNSNLLPKNLKGVNILEKPLSLVELTQQLD
jgi:two-component system OmpR family response regulator